MHKGQADLEGGARANRVARAVGALENFAMISSRQAGQNPLSFLF